MPELQGWLTAGACSPSVVKRDIVETLPPRLSPYPKRSNDPSGSPTQSN